MQREGQKCAKVWVTDIKLSLSQRKRQPTYRSRGRNNISKTNRRERDKDEIQRCSEVPPLQSTIYAGHYGQKDKYDWQGDPHWRVNLVVRGLEFVSGIIHPNAVYQPRACFVQVMNDVVSHDGQEHQCQRYSDESIQDTKHATDERDGGQVTIPCGKKGKKGKSKRDTWKDC